MMNMINNVSALLAALADSYNTLANTNDNVWKASVVEAYRTNAEQLHRLAVVVNNGKITATEALVKAQEFVMPE